MHIFLIRHPQPDVLPELCYGQSDLSLVEQPFSLAKQLQHQLPENLPVFSSPLLRCRLLADAMHPQAIYDDRLKEMHFGEWEMQPWSSIPRQQLDDWAADPLHYEIPGGESVAQMQKRVLDFIKEKQEQGKENLVLVTHAGVIKIFLGLQNPLSDWMSIKINYGSLHKIYWNTYEK